MYKTIKYFNKTQILIMFHSFKIYFGSFSSKVWHKILSYLFWCTVGGDWSSSKEWTQSVTMKTFSLSLYLEGVAAVRSEGEGQRKWVWHYRAGRPNASNIHLAVILGHSQTLSSYFLSVSILLQMKKWERYTKEQTETNDKHTKDQNKVSWIFKKSRKKQNCQPKDRTQRNIQYKLR